VADEFSRKTLVSGQLGPGVTAVQRTRHLSGVRVERSEIGLPGEFGAMQDDELERVVRDRFQWLFPLDATPGACDQWSDHAERRER
jgi:hypothetical protein